MTKLQEKAARVMKANKVDTCFVTADGNVFLKNKESHAIAHARSTGQKVQTIKLSDLEKSTVEKEKKQEDNFSEEQDASNQTTKKK